VDNNKNSIRNNNFDLLRLYAALSVLLTHSLHHLYNDFGYIPYASITFFHELTTYVKGVPVFFLISGYLISMSYTKNSDIIDYTKNRVLRIYPALIINVFIGVFILYIFGFVTFNTIFFKWLFAQLSIVQFYNLEMARGFGVGVINGSLWTISVELTFYILLPILFLLYRKRKYLIVGLFFISFILWIYGISSDKEIFFNKLLQSTIAPYLFLFIIGMWFYVYHNKVLKYIENKFPLWVILFIVFHLSISFFDLNMNFFIYIMKWLIFSFMLFSFAFSYRSLSQKLLKGNDYTYGIYIYHMLVINVFVHLGFIGDIKYLVLVFLFTIILSLLSWYIIEKPLLKLKKHSLSHEVYK
jgi:peptidoglycan/LPS O-acetylase OafA/YrhL